MARRGYDGRMKMMVIYLVIMGAGIALGYRSKRLKAHSRSRSLFQNACLLIILFLLGHQLGTDEEVVKAATSMGLVGLALSLSAMAGSFGIVLLLMTLTVNLIQLTLTGFFRKEG